MFILIVRANHHSLPVKKQLSELIFYLKRRRRHNLFLNEFNLERLENVNLFATGNRPGNSEQLNFTAIFS